MHKLAQPLTQALTYPAAAPLSGLTPFLGGGEPVTPEPEVAQTVFDHDTVTLAGNNEPGTQITAGMVIQATTQGEFREVSFFKSAGDIATSRSVAIYLAADGTLQASGTSTGEPTGVAQWVTVELDDPLPVDALVKYVAAVHYPSGSYPHQAGVFVDAVIRGDLLAESRSGAPNQGRYKYGVAIAYPDVNADGASFGVDVGFFPDAFPTADSAGVASGVTLTPQSGGVSLWDGGSTIIENVDLVGFITIQSENCIVRNCRIRNNDAGVTAVIRVDTGITTGAGLLVENCEIDGDGITVNGIAGEGTFQNNKIVGVDNGINVYGPSLIKGNFILCDASASPEPHFDGIEINGGSNIEIRHNTVGVNQGQTSAVMMNNFFSGLSEITIIDNYLWGGGYTVYCDNGHGAGAVDAASIRITYNRMGTGLFGYFALYTSGVTPTNNVDATTGDPV